MTAGTAQLKTVTVDIRTRFIDDNTRIYILFPGHGYRYFEEMRRDSIVFLDIPGFPLFCDGQFPQRSDVIKSIVMSDRIRDWHNRGMPQTEIPSRDVSEIADYRVSNWRSQFAGMIENFFKVPKKGDIFIVPGPNEDSPVLFGELDSEPGQCIGFISKVASNEVIPARKVRWIKEVPRHSLPRWLDKKIPSPNPVRQLDRSDFRYIFDMMYERYYYDGHFAVKIATESDEFTALDSYLFNQVVLYVAALHENIHEDNIKYISDTPIGEVVAKISFSEDIPEQRVIIQSPGFIVLDAKNIIPMVACVFMALSAATPAGAEPLQTKIVNSADQSALAASCAGDIEAEVNQDIEMMGYKRWQELCRAELEARKRTQLNSGMTVKK